LEECRYYPVLAHDLNYLNKTVLWEMSEEVGRLLNGYRRALLTPNSIKFITLLKPHVYTVLLKKIKKSEFFLIINL